MDNKNPVSRQASRWMHIVFYFVLWERSIDKIYVSCEEMESLIL
jgi:hypothetical protein